MPPVEFEHPIPVRERPQTPVLDLKATRGVIKGRIHNYELTNQIYLLSAINDRSDVADAFCFSWAADAVQRFAEHKLHTRSSSFEQG
jgi:hypothetical protein